MLKAYVLIETEVGTTVKVVSLLKAIEGVVSCDMITGGYDAMVIAETLDMKTLSELLNSQLRAVPGVLKTITCVAIPR